MRVVLLPRKSNPHLLPSIRVDAVGREHPRLGAVVSLPSRLHKLIALLPCLPLHTSELSLAPIALIELPVS